ncbi:bifunctional metallophosphatase/5'-nucleotidase [Solibacillus sp. FSL H8-0538]|uniref:bifunctional metallophosphatase/5'-nucleotidase n=1 Tax=Solibacillus sp. FSL H8-0538 TaxID=2921400 RepID=UPI0030FA9E53
MKFTILATSDVHGQAERFSKLAHMICSKQPALLIDNGDFLQGSHLSYFYERVKKSPHPLLQMANELKYDVAVFGNHEFNYTLSEIEKMRLACNFPWIAGNIGDFSKAYYIKEIENIRVAVVGIVTHHVPVWDEENLTQNLTFTDALEAAKHWVHYVREQEQPNLVILCYHGGFERDVDTGIPYDENMGENQGYAMLQEIDGIDIFITGHQHLQFATKVGTVPVIQPGSHAHCLAQIDVTIENGCISHEPSLVFVDEEAAGVTFSEVDAWLDLKVGYVNGDMSFHDFMEIRLADHPYLQFLHNVQLEASNAQLSVTELFYHDCGGFSGNVTIRDILKNYPRANYLQVIKLSGAEIREALEQCATVFAIDKDREIALSTMVYYPEPQPYVYDFWGGIEYELNISKAVGKRVTKLLYKGEQILNEATFEVVVNSYRATGAHGFHMMKKQAIREIRIDIPELMMRYFKKNSPIQLTDIKNWHVIKNS